jgi:hypothetical protein
MKMNVICLVERHGQDELHHPPAFVFTDQQSDWLRDHANRFHTTVTDFDPSTKSQDVRSAADAQFHQYLAGNIELRLVAEFDPSTGVFTPFEHHSILWTSLEIKEQVQAAIERIKAA